jgi:membrane protein YdbS with pleckstrin-like domain
VETLQRLDQMKLFDGLPRAKLTPWADKFRRESYEKQDIIIRKDARATDFYIVDSGNLRVQDAGKPLAYLYEGDYFGETGLLTGNPRNATISASTEVELLVLGKRDFEQLLEEFPQLRARLTDLGERREEAGRIRLPWQHPNEVTVFYSAKHWMALLRAWRLTFVMGLLGAAAGAACVGLALPDFVTILLLIVSGVLLGLTLFFIGYHYLDWRNDYYVVTNLRVLHVERVLLLREDRDEAPLERIQDVQVRQDGLLPNMLDYGDVVIQTAAATEQIVFADVPRPDFVRDALFSPVQQAQARSEAEVRESIRQELGQRLGLLEPPPEEQPPEEPAPPPEEPAAEEDVLDALTRLARSAWEWLMSQITLETWLYSDGGATVIWRKNGWLLFSLSIPPFLTALGLLAAIVWFIYQGVGLPQAPLVLLFLLLPVAGWWMYIYWDWQNDIYSVSGNRLIDLKKRPLFLAETRRETTLDRVQNISLSIPGPIAQLLNYGSVIIETAGEEGAFKFVYVHDPRRVQAEIFNRLEDFKSKQRESELQSRLAETAEWFEVYEQLKQEEQQIMQGTQDERNSGAG